jgi:hypothetical protein
MGSKSIEARARLCYDAAMHPLRSVVLLLSLCAGCASSGGSGGGGGTAVSTPKALLVDDRSIVTAGPRCTGGACRCREVGPDGATVGDASEDAKDAAPEGQKRFELRTGRGADDVTVTVEGRGTLHKGSDTVDSACGYVDLPPGEHRVRVRIKAPAGHIASPRLLIYEHGEETHSWYSTFAMACGTGAPCTRDELTDRMNELKKPRGLFDACGSVKVGGIRYDSQRDAEDRTTELDLQVTLKVYPFAPRFPHGAPKCKGPSAE